MGLRGNLEKAGVGLKRLTCSSFVWCNFKIPLWTPGSGLFFESCEPRFLWEERVVVPNLLPAVFNRSAAP
jgi:hypothetical protein